MNIRAANEFLSDAVASLGEGIGLDEAASKEDMLKVMEYGKDVKAGDKAVLCWSAGSGGQYCGKATIKKVSAKSVAGVLDQEVKSKIGGEPYPKDHKITGIPRALWGSDWTWSKVVMPIDLAKKLGRLK